MTTKFLTVAGAVSKPATMEVPVGITLTREAMKLAGGATVPEAGGAGRRRHDGPVQKSDDLEEPITKTTGGLIVPPRRSWAGASLYVRPGRRSPADRGVGVCDQCSFCTEFCPRYLLGPPHRAAQGHAFPGVQHGRRG